ncbi:sensor histidine kinase [Streptomyces sp. NBC_00209]|uniref:sensor histidine kinase n=1 Tax=Streptomyces sp. NBC_00209 TaxID=2975682 RepID=UPI0032537F15
MWRIRMPGSIPQQSRRGPVHKSDLAPRVAAVITIVVITCVFAVAVTYVLRAPHTTGELVGSFVLLFALLGLQLNHSFPALVSWATPYRGWRTLGVQAVLTYAPFTVFGAAWMGIPGFLAGSVLLLLRGPARVLLCGSVVASVVAIQFAVGFGRGEVGYNAVATLLTALVVYGLSRLATLMHEVQVARGELIRMAVDRERIRFSRDLHDLLGYSLTTIKLKGELACRLVALRPEQAEREMREILALSNQALVDMRSVASSYRELRLSTEVGAAESLLNAMGISTIEHTDVGPLSAAADTVLATVLREGITNLLRHSKAEQCRIEARDLADGTARITVANDGVGTAFSHLGPEGGDSGGSGLESLTARVEALGGRLRAGVRTDDGWFELMAALPRDAAWGSETRSFPARQAVRVPRLPNRRDESPGRSAPVAAPDE